MTSKISALAATLLTIVQAHAAEEPSDRKILPAPAFTAQQLLAPPRDGWITNGGNLYNQRYSPLTGINRDNVGKLKAEWRASLGGSGVGPQYSGQAQPIVHDGVMYIITGANDVFAIDIESGAILWTYKSNLDPSRVVVCCGWVSRGVGIGDGRIFVGQVDGKLLALDQRNGKVLWSIQAEDPKAGYSLTTAPLYYDGMVITGFAGGDMGIRGRVKAYDAKSGELKWTFYTIPGPGEFGHDTWPADNEVWKYGGAAVWQTPALDPELGMLYFSTGNPAPDLNGSARKGDNLFSVSIVAIDVKTGRYRWHFQQVKHDIWDYDSPNPVILFDTQIDGRLRRGLAQVSKTGWAYILDRITGEPLVGIEDRPVPQEPRQHTSPTQPYPIGDALVRQSIDAAPEGFELINEGRIFTPFWDKPVVYSPQAAINWPPSSYDPESSLMYVCANEQIGSAVAHPAQLTPPTFEGMWLGGAFSVARASGRGIFAALDVRTNRIAWRQQWADPCRSGSTVTAGGLVFVGRSDGRLTALDKRNGMKLWEFQTDFGIHTPVSVFEHKGRDYVAVLAAGTLFAGPKKGDSVWLFSLDGKLGPAAVAASPAAPGAGAVVRPDATATARGDAANGRKLYVQTCLPCHGDKGLGGHGGGATLAPVGHDLNAVINTVTTGKNTMPAFGAALTSEQIRDVATYIVDELF